jgi:hypothetical protein
VPEGPIRRDLQGPVIYICYIEDTSGQDRSVISTREGGVSRSAASSQRKSSGSATRHESELRLRKLLQHSNEKLDRSEQARTEFEGRLKLLQDVLNHRDQMIQHMELYSNRHFQEYQDMSTPNWST